MKKILFLVLILATFIVIFCLSSSASDYGQQFLDPDYYEDDIAMVIGLYYDSDDTIFIPLMQIRVPDYSGGSFECDIDVSNWSGDGSSILASFVIRQDSYVGELNNVLVDLSDIAFSDLNTYYIQSSYYDDPYFYIEEGSYQIDLFATDLPYTSISESIIFFTLYCDEIHPEFSLPNPSTLEIPTYPVRPLPDPEDPPIPSGSISAILTNMFTYPIDLFEDITITTGTLTLFLSAVGFVFFVRFILMPVFGVLPAGVSDSVKAVRSELKERRSERRMLRRADRNYRRSRR